MEVRTSNTRTIGICVRRRVQFKPNQYHNLSSPVLKSIFRELDTAAPQIEKKSFRESGYPTSSRVWFLPGRRVTGRSSTKCFSIAIKLSASACVIILVSGYNAPLNALSRMDGSIASSSAAVSAWDFFSDVTCAWNASNSSTIRRCSKREGTGIIRFAIRFRYKQGCAVLSY